jgi:hypothetical protein
MEINIFGILWKFFDISGQKSEREKWKEITTTQPNNNNNTKNNTPKVILFFLSLTVSIKKVLIFLFCRK